MMSRERGGEERRRTARKGKEGDKVRCGVCVCAQGSFRGRYWSRNLPAISAKIRQQSILPMKRGCRCFHADSDPIYYEAPSIYGQNRTNSMR